MMNFDDGQSLIDKVRSMSEHFIEKREYDSCNSLVRLNRGKMDLLAGNIKKDKKPVWDKSELDGIAGNIRIISEELLAGAINYCYWYGTSDVRPTGGGSTHMYDMVNKHTYSAPVDYTELCFVSE